MGITRRFGDVPVQVGSDFVAIVEIQRPPSNFFDVELIRSISDAYEMLDADTTCRAIVLCSQGKHFRAGANLTPAVPPSSSSASGPSNDLYGEAARMIQAKTPVVAAIQGAAVGGGLGLACSADFRVGCPEARMTSNSSQLGFHHGFGLTVTLPPSSGSRQHSNCC